MSDIGHKLHRETEAARVLRAQIADLIEGDEQCAADMVEAETDLNSAIDATVCRILEDQISIAGLDAYIAKLTTRRDRLKERTANMRAALAVAMEQAGRAKIEHCAVTISLRPAPASVVATDEARIPAKFWKTGEPKLDKRALLTALKAKEDVPGAQLSNGGVTLAMAWS